MWGATLTLLIKKTHTVFQSTHPCGVRLETIQNRFDDLDVSIHAPVWGATSLDQVPQRVSSFNPRTRVGCDKVLTLSLDDLKVSIHAPVWGATMLAIKMDKRIRSFNPRTRVGCDQRR